jgi:hypothetical protein
MNRTHWRVGVTVVFAAGLTAPLWAADALLKLEPTPLVVPLRIGPLDGNPSGHRFPEAGLGTSYMYRAPGAVLTVYVYDGDQENLADGPDTIPVCHEFESAKRHIAQAYPGAKLVSEHMVRLLPPAESPLMREAVFEIAHQGNELISYIWISTVAGQFIKLRFTMDATLRHEVADARRAVLAAFGEAIQPHLRAVESPEEKSGTTLGVNFDRAGDLDAVALMYAMLLSAVAEETPESAPPCGGEFVPGFETEVGLYRGLFTGEESLDDSRFGKQVAKAEAAGFLEEFVWVERHRDAWGETPPGELNLSEYRAWKKKNLKRFKAPSFGTVSIGRPRSLPLEPAGSP